MFKKILIANDGSAGAKRALRSALSLAHGTGAELHMISVEDMPRFPASVDELVEEKSAADHRFAATVRHAQQLAKSEGVKLKCHVVAGHAVPAIIEFAEKSGIDLLIVGFMGHSALYNRLIGGTTDRLVDLAPCTVLVVK